MRSSAGSSRRRGGGGGGGGGAPPPPPPTTVAVATAAHSSTRAERWLVWAAREWVRWRMPMMVSCRGSVRGVSMAR
ncbi:hypothetical protein [Nocardia abscessus]|uniref:hypothetical protein n=1 Tax=Nocardia abscessus TaxID=120957 RepID=UPI002457272B|nr:hypothetical protein [Nocardia abscessus]